MDIFATESVGSGAGRYGHYKYESKTNFSFCYIGTRFFSDLSSSDRRAIHRYSIGDRRRRDDKFGGQQFRRRRDQRPTGCRAACDRYSLLAACRILDGRWCRGFKHGLGQWPGTDSRWSRNPQRHGDDQGRKRIFTIGSLKCLRVLLIPKRARWR